MSKFQTPMHGLSVLLLSSSIDLKAVWGDICLNTLPDVERLRTSSLEFYSALLNGILFTPNIIVVDCDELDPLEQMFNNKLLKIVEGLRNVVVVFVESEADQFAKQTATHMMHITRHIIAVGCSDKELKNTLVQLING